jgi:translocator protein
LNNALLRIAQSRLIATPDKESYMGELASQTQLRMSFARRALFTVPLIVFLGFLVGSLSNSGDENRWFAALAKPAIQPPGWVFGAAWMALYTVTGLALALILNARSAQGRGLAIGLFAFQFTLNLIWSPTFFMAHQVTAAFWLILVILFAAILTTFAFGRIRMAAAWLMLPYLLWLSFASILNYKFDQMNPAAETLVPDARKTQVLF